MPQVSILNTILDLILNVNWLDETQYGICCFLEQHVSSSVFPLTVGLSVALDEVSCDLPA